MILYDHLSNAPLVDESLRHQLIRRDHLAVLFYMTAQSVMPERRHAIVSPSGESEGDPPETYLTYYQVEPFHRFDSCHSRMVKILSVSRRTSLLRVYRRALGVSLLKP